MTRKNYRDRRFVSDLIKFLKHKKPGWTYKRMNNGHYEILPRDEAKKHLRPRFVNNVNTAKHEDAVLSAIATRAFLSPSYGDHNAFVRAFGSILV